MRKLLIAANWKMYKTPIESTAFLTSFYPLIKQNTQAEILLCPAMTSLAALIDPAIAAPIVFAYEPVWAIGTGRTATPEIAAEAHKLIRAQIAKSLTPTLAASIRILYGGSVKPDNAKSLCCLEDIDGALVGGASLDPQSVADIVQNATAR